MLIVKFKTSSKLLIKKSLTRLIQSAIYKHLPKKEHTGYKSKSGKIFKAFSFKTYYRDDTIYLYFSSIDIKYENHLAMVVLNNEFKIGEVNIFEKTISIKEIEINGKEIIAQGAIAVKVKGVNGKPLYLTPQDSRFYEILKNNIKERYEALLNKEFSNNLEIELINTLKPQVFYYSQDIFKLIPAFFKFKGDKDILEFILKSGIGSNSAKGVGMLELKGLTKITE